MTKGSDHFGFVESFDQIAEQFVSRIRRGEHPSINEYKEAYPAFVADIDELFPTLAELENYDPVGISNQTSKTRHYEAPEKLGDYIINREIGRGGMGVVYEAEHETMRRRVALKVLPDHFSEPKHKQRFLREARAAGQLHHTNIVPVFEVGEAEGVNFYAMQYIHGQNLDVVIEELRHFEESGGKTSTTNKNDITIGNSGIAQTFLSGDFKQSTGQTTQVSAIPIEANAKADVTRRIDAATRFESSESAANGVVEESNSKTNSNSSGSSQWSQIGDAGDSYYRRVARVGVQIAEALQYAHNHGVLHRDIKPANLILDTDGVVWVTDFGLAKDDSDNLTHTGDIVGTLRYMAPERFKGDADVRSEVYSLGLTLYELCTLRHAFDHSDRAQLVQQVTSHEPVSPRKIRPDMPVDLETVIAKSIAREPSRRYSSARQMAADLQRFIADRPVLARRVSFSEKVYRWARRHPARAALVSCLLLICLMATGGSMYLAELNNRHAVELQIENIRVINEKNKTELALEKANRANLASNAHLYYSYLGQAQAPQSNGNQGQNFGSLKSVQMAAAIVPKLNLSPEKVERRHLNLRTAAIAAMARWDVDPVYRWKTEENWTTEIAVDFVNQRVAQSDQQGNFAIRKFGSNEVEFLLPGPGEKGWVTIFSADGKFLLTRYHNAVTQANPVTYLWDVDAQKEILRLEPVTLGAAHCFSDDSSKFAVVRPGNNIEVYSTKTGELKFTLPMEDSPLHVRFARDSRQLAVWQKGHEEIDFWKLADKPEIVESVAIESEKVTAIDWNDKLSQLAVAVGNEILVWPAEQLEETPIRLVGHGSRVVKLVLHPTKKVLISTSWDGTTRLFSLTTKEEVVRLEGTRLTFGGFNEDGSLIGYTSKTDEFGVWRLPENIPTRALISNNEPGARREAVFVPGHTALVAYATALGVEIWNQFEQEIVALIPSGKTTQLIFNSSGSQMFTSGENGLSQWSIKVSKNEGQYDIQFGPEPTNIMPGNTNSFDFNESKQLIAVKVRSDYVTILNLNTNETLEIGPHTSATRPMFSPDGQFLATLTWHGLGIKVWDTKAGEMFKDIAPETSTASSDVSIRNNSLVVVSGDSRTEWSMDDWSQLSHRRRLKPDGWPGDASYSPDGKLLATAYSRYLPQLIDVETGNTIAVLEAPIRFPVGGLDWSDDGNYLSVSGHEKIQIWDISQIRKRLQDLDIDWKN